MAARREIKLVWKWQISASIQAERPLDKTSKGFVCRGRFRVRAQGCWELPGHGRGSLPGGTAAQVVAGENDYENKLYKGRCMHVSMHTCVHGVYVCVCMVCTYTPCMMETSSWKSIHENVWSFGEMKAGRQRAERNNASTECRILSTRSGPLLQSLVLLGLIGVRAYRNGQHRQREASSHRASSLSWEKKRTASFFFVLNGHVESQGQVSRECHFNPLWKDNSFYFRPKLSDWVATVKIFFSHSMNNFHGFLPDSLETCVFSVLASIEQVFWRGRFKKRDRVWSGLGSAVG